jgi:sodium-independent sulfate anion transporter 11
MAATKLGHGLAKVLGIKLQNPTVSDGEILRGESIFSSQTAGNYVEEEPRTLDALKQIVPEGKQVLDYFISLFPFLHWIDRYNLQWLAGDLVAGTLPHQRKLLG